MSIQQELKEIINNEEQKKKKDHKNNIYEIKAAKKDTHE